MPLAVQDDPSLSKFTPQLATTWSVDGSKLIIRLRHGVRWQDGSRVTSRDVYDTILEDGTEGGAGWANWVNLSDPNPYEVVVTARSGTNMTLAEDSLLPTYIFPASIYGRFATSALKQDEIKYYALDSSDPAAASKSPASASLGRVFTKLASLRVPRMTGDGPFQLRDVTTAEAKLTKWGGFYRSRKVHIPGIDYVNNPNSQIYPLLFGRKADFSNVYLPPAELERWQQTPDARTALPLSFDTMLEFNCSRYPLNEVKVRQALAYIIPRKVAEVFTNGTSPASDGITDARPAGLPNFIESKYLTTSQLTSLNSYAVNHAKAATLLRSAGFHKAGSKWITPKGAPFTLSFLINSATYLPGDNTITSALNSFGIRTTLDSTEGAVTGQDQSDGDFDMGLLFVGGVNPLSLEATVLGTANNFISLGSYAGKRGIGFGPTETVPGLGSTQIATTLTHEAATVGPGAHLNQLVWDWARLVNQQVPDLSWYTKRYQFEYSTENFTDWPPVNSHGTSPLWNIMGQGNMDQALSLMLQYGYIHPKV